MITINKNCYKIHREKKIRQNSIPLGQCRNLRFTIGPIQGYRLENDVIRTINVSNADVCQLQCFLEPITVSVTTLTETRKMDNTNVI